LYYSNWNFFYSSLALNNLNKKERTKYSIGEYPHKLFHMRKNDSSEGEILQEKSENNFRKNQNFFLKKLKIYHKEN